MELENLILKIYHDTGRWIADCVGTGPGVGGGPDQSSSNQDERRELGNDHLALPCQMRDPDGIVYNPCESCWQEEHCPYEQEDDWELM